MNELERIKKRKISTHPFVIDEREYLLSSLDCLTSQQIYANQIADMKYEKMHPEWFQNENI